MTNRNDKSVSQHSTSNPLSYVADTLKKIDGRGKGLNTSTSMRVANTEDQNKSKIVELQEELLKIRKEYSILEAESNKQRKGLLTKIELLSMENGELRQRHNNLNKINKTLELALETNDQITPRMNKKEQNSVNTKQGKIVFEQKKIIDDLRQKLKFAEQEITLIRQQKDRQIQQMFTNLRQLKIDKDIQYKNVKETLNSLPFNRQVMEAILKALNLHQQNRCQDQFKYQEAAKFQPTPNTRKSFTKGLNISSSRISDYSIIAKTNNSKTLVSQSSLADETSHSQRLLCEICKKVFYEEEFINHMQKCSQSHDVNRRKIKIQKQFRNMDTSGSKSISQQKKSNKQTQMTIKQVNLNQNWGEKIANKASVYTGKQSMDEMKKMVSQLSKSQSKFNNFRSNKLY